VTQVTQKERSSEPTKKRPPVTALLALGFMFPASLLAGYGLGYAADAWLGTKPWGAAAGTVLGAAAAYVNMVRLIHMVSSKANHE
jgi:F0F1-type ATP synthase assembly protein I